MAGYLKICRRKSIGVKVANVMIGGGAPIAVQSMTNTDTADIGATAKQIVTLAQAGSELVRITVDRKEAAACVAEIRDRVRAAGCDVPIVGDFHYVGHTLLRDFPECAEALDKYRINPGNVGFKAKRDRNYSTMIEKAIEYDKPVRIGVNWGSLDQDMLAANMDANSKLAEPKDIREVMHETMVNSALVSAKRAEEIGLARNKIIISVKVSEVQDLIACYRNIAARCDYSLHLGLTEAGIGSRGIVASTAGLSVLLQQGIGDTVRISLTPEPDGDRSKEVIVAQEILQSLGLRAFAPMIIACPGCGRTSSTVFQELAQDTQDFLRDRLPEWRKHYKGFECLQIAVMGCIVNGPGESKHADIGISLPGTGEIPAAPVFIDGKKAMILRGGDIADQFKAIVEEYVCNRWGNGKTNAAQ